MRLHDLAERFLAERRLTAPSECAWLGLRSKVRLLLEFLDTEELETAGELTPEVLAHFQNFLFYRPTRFGKPPTAGYQAAVLGVVRSFMRYLLREGFLLIDPASSLENPHVPRRLPRALSRAQAERLLATPDPENPLGCRDAAMLEILYATGCRASELLNLKLSDLALDGPWLRIVGGKGGKDRVVPLGTAAATACRLYLDTARPRFRNAAYSRLIFLSYRGKPLSITALNKLLRGYAGRAGLAERLSAHRLRHTCATVMLAAGCDIRYIQALLGHTSLATTQLYTKVEIADLARAHARYHPRSFSRQTPRPRNDDNPACAVPPAPRVRRRKRR
ncbi:MAG: tyrosine-type recombinase/integrase [Candidatus Riflebacteria bacterium]|nr:tyrosine-type recombinase/integrase [Candidatus Riflebacteria bacterium]